MKKLSTYLLVMFMIMFWILRIIIELSSELGRDFIGIKPINSTFEIILLFAFLVCLVLVIKRKLVGPLLYLTLHAIYFGGDITTKLNTLSANGTLSMTENVELMISTIGIILPLAVLLDYLLDKNRKNNPKDKKTDWFYGNKEYERKLDERADKNNYRTL